MSIISVSFSSVLSNSPNIHNSNYAVLLRCTILKMVLQILNTNRKHFCHLQFNLSIPVSLLKMKYDLKCLETEGLPEYHQCVFFPPFLHRGIITKDISFTSVSSSPTGPSANLPCCLHSASIICNSKTIRLYGPAPHLMEWRQHVI